MLIKKNIEFEEVVSELQEKAELITSLTTSMKEMKQILRNTQTELANLKFQTKPYVAFLKGEWVNYIENASVEDRVVNLENDLAKANSVNVANSLVINNLLV